MTTYTRGPSKLFTFLISFKRRLLLFYIEMDSNIYAPLSEACAKTLSDKLHEKRRIAALEIEK